MRCFEMKKTACDAHLCWFCYTQISWKISIHRLLIVLVYLIIQRANIYIYMPICWESSSTMLTAYRIQLHTYHTTDVPPFAHMESSLTRWTGTDPSNVYLRRYLKDHICIRQPAALSEFGGFSHDEFMGDIYGGFTGEIYAGLIG